MEIIRGSLDDISRPASSEQAGSRVSSVSLPHSDRVCPTSPFSLVVLTSDAADVPGSSNETVICSSASVHYQDEEKGDSQLQQAIEEMRRLDKILSAKIRREKEVRCQRQELQRRLWKELLQSKPEGQCESAPEALNTRLFLALEAPHGTEDEEDEEFVSLFETQVPESNRDGHKQHFEQSEKSPSSSAESFEMGEDQFKGSYREASKGKKKHKDFVKRNIELVSGEGGQMLLTQAEKERLAELLREIDEEEEDSTRGADREEDMWAVSLLTGQGYTPEPSDLEQLIDIDSKMRLLLPAEQLLSVQSSYTNFSELQGHGSEVGWKCDGDPQPGEKVLQDIKERRGQERRLQEIQQQLEILGQSQEMTDDSPDLTEEQLLCLLDECELTESWSKDTETTDTTPRDHKNSH